MNGVFMSVDITYYDHGIAPMCRFYEIVNGTPCTSRKLTLEDAHRLAWELKLAGGMREYRTNQFTPHIHYLTVTYHMCH